MPRCIFTRSTMGFLALLGLVCSAFVFAQQAPQGQAQGQGRGGAQAGRGGGGGGAQRASAAPLFLKVEWVRPASQTEQTAVVQENLADANIELKQYAPAAKQLLTSGNPGSPTAPFSVWSGECEGPFAITFRHKTNFVNLSGLSRVRWTVKTSGFHVVRPVVKLADGTMLVGDHESAAVPMLSQVEFSLSGIRWIKMDPARAVTLNAGDASRGAANEIWFLNPDLSRVDEVGFADLMPASGHGTGGYIHIAGIEVYGQPVPR